MDGDRWGGSGTGPVAREQDLEAVVERVGILRHLAATPPHGACFQAAADTVSAHEPARTTNLPNLIEVPRIIVSQKPH